MMRTGRFSKKSLLVLALSLAFGVSAYAQRTSSGIRGTVYDSTGAVVSAATVTVTNQATGLASTQNVDSKGEFVFPLLDPGTYEIQVTAPAFKKYTKQDVVLRALETATVSVKLELGPVEEAIVVTADTEQVDVSSGGVAQRLSTEMLSNFPNLNKYGFANATLLPSVGQYEERRETINASVGGNTTNRNSFYIDGAEATDPWRGWSPRQPVADAFEEIVVNTAGATPDTGSNFGGTYNAILKSGSNTFHGGAWYYFRDKSLNANSWVNNESSLDRPNDPLKYWGAQVGGPIMRDKIFFYVTGNRETDSQPFSVHDRFAPTQAMVGGDFSALPFTIYNPDTGQPFPGNVIPQDMLDPVAVNFWNQFGYTIPTYGPDWGFQFANERKVWNFDGRLDFNINQQHRLTISGYWFQNKTTSPDARVQSISGSPTGGTTGNTFGPSLLGGTELSDFPQTVVNLKHTWMVKPNFFIETHGSYSDMPERVTLDSAALQYTLQTFGANDPLPRPDAPELLPTIVIGQWWGGQETSVLFHGWTTDFEVKNLTLGSSATWVTGSHNIKLGAEFQSGDYHEVQVARENNNGITFNGNATSLNNPSNGGLGATYAHAFADFMLGRFDYYSESDQSVSTLKSWNLAGYLMDQWRVTPRWTITPGLRLEVNSGITEKNNHLTMYRPGLQSTMFPNAPAGVVVAGDAGLSDSFTGTFVKLAPRFNTAYDLTGDGKTAVRGSAGLYYGRDALALYQTAFLNRAPYVGARYDARNGRLSNPWLTSQNPTYSAVPLPFVDQNPANYVWGSQIGGLFGLSPDYNLASSWQWNVAVEREIFKGVRLELGYQGNSSTNEPTQIPTNLAVFAPGANDDGSNIQSRRPNQFLGDNGPWIENRGRSRYDQILLISHWRIADFFGQLSWDFTYARRNFGGGFPLQNNNRDWDQGILYPDSPDSMLNYMKRQAISGYLMYNLPIFRNNQEAAGKILGGWTISADGYWQFARKDAGTVYLGYDSNADGYGNDLAGVNGTISYPKTEISGQGDLLYQWVDPGAFTYADGGSVRTFTPTVTYGGLNAVTQMPGRWGLNAALMKDFPMPRDAKLQLRFEVYNLFNHANLNDPNLSLTNADFGAIRGKYGDGRRMQLGARLQF